MKKKEINGAKFGIPKPKRKTSYGEHEDIANPDGPLSAYESGPLGITDMSPGSILPVPGDMGDSIAKIWDMPFGSAGDTIADSAEQYTKVMEALEKMKKEMEEKEQDEEEESKPEDGQSEQPQEDNKNEQEVWTRYINAFRRIHALGLVCGSMTLGSSLPSPFVYIPILASKNRPGTDGLVDTQVTTFETSIDGAKDFMYFNLTTGLFHLPFFDSKEKCDAFIVIGEKMIEEFITATIETNKALLDNLEKPFKVIM